MWGEVFSELPLSAQEQILQQEVSVLDPLPGSFIHQEECLPSQPGALEVKATSRLSHKLSHSHLLF